MIDFHTHSDELEEGIIKIRSVYPNESFVKEERSYHSVGLHPWFLTKDNRLDSIAWLEQELGSQNVLALGECGLDRLQGESLKFQQEVFEEQLKLADEFQKPVIIHCVKAFQELIESVRRVQPKAALVVHGFNKKESIFRMLEAEGFYFSFGASILNERSPSYEILRKIDGNRFFLETDDQEISIKKIYEQASFLRNSELSNTLANIIKNIQNIGIHV